MMTVWGIPSTRYLRVDGAELAYQVVGEGPIDVLSMSGMGHVDVQWHYPPTAHLNRAIASFARLILFDRRGTGASSRVPRPGVAISEDWTDDVRAILDAVDSASAAVLAAADAGATGVLFSALHPERVRALVLANTTARFSAAPDYPIGASSEQVEGVLAMLETLWGTPDFMHALFPSMADDPEFIRVTTSLFRAAMTPAAAVAQFRHMFESVDVRPMLPLVQAPTLVMHNAVNPIVGSEHGEFLAKNLPDARFISLPGVGATWDPDDQDVIVAELAEFLTGVRPHRPATRILATVMFTDIVGSTERVAHLGDRDWHALLDAHDRAVREQLERFGGQEIGTTGDGFVSTFEGPARAIRCARAITKVLREIGLLIRVGLHTGECELRRNGDLAGISVHIAARVCALARADETLVTSAGRDLAAGSEITFRDTGDHELKGVPGSWRLYAAEIRGG